jgi:uncharacterized membrane protein YcaP (DUF421 family)
MDKSNCINRQHAIMKPDEIKLNDWMRIFFGTTPPAFFIELVIRTFIIFLILLISMRLLGRRMAAQLNRIEMIALFSLAAAVGVPLQAPDRGLLPAVIIAIVVVVIGRLVVSLAFKSQKFESVAEGDYTTLVLDGTVLMHKLKMTRLTIERLFAQLRGEGIRHLGEVKRLYFEANGSFTLIRAEKPMPGLVIIPGFDRELLETQKQAEELVCQKCGHKQADQKQQENKCGNCGHREWIPAVE